MKSKSKILFFIFFLPFQTLFVSCYTSQSTISNSENTAKIVDLEVDKLGDYYLIDRNNNITKYDKNRKPLFSYSNNHLGQPSAIDVLNPHKILIFYKEQQTLVFLDNTLSEFSIVDLNSESYYSAAGMANDGNIWLFDSYYDKLVKINLKGEQIEESFPLEEINSTRIIGSKIIERGNIVMITDDNDNIFLYTNLGYFIGKMQLPGIVKPTIFDNKIYYYNRNKYTYAYFDLKYKEKIKIYQFKDLKPNVVIYENDNFYILSNNKISILHLRND